MVATNVPDVYDRVLVLFQTTLTDLQDKGRIFDGAPIGYDVPDDYAAVGFRGPSSEETGLDEPAVYTTAQRSDWGNQAYDEQFAIWCTISSASGGVDMPSRRARIRDWLNQLDTALRVDCHLGGAVPAPGFAAIDATEWTFDPNQSGSVATVAFSISVVLKYY